MSQAVHKDHSTKKFLDKILRRRLLLRSSTTSSKSTLNSDAELTDPRAELKSSGSDTYIDTGENMYNSESEDDTGGGEVMLDTDADVMSTESLEREALNNQHETVEFPMLGDDHDDEQPWANLTYESLVFPKLVKATRKSNKSPKMLSNLFLAQELRCPLADEDTVAGSDKEPELAMGTPPPTDESALPMNPNEILVMEFSRDGKYLAVAGRNACITVWQVISSPLSRLQYKNYESQHDDDDTRAGKLKMYGFAPVFHQEPIRVFEGHTSTILSIDWSKNNFLVSGSMDRTVKLWHVDRTDCLETFQHDDFVTSVKFHPCDDRFFASGSLDNCVRLWSILESSVAYTNNLGDNVLVTALTFTPAGNFIIVGGFNGSLFVLETQGLHLIKRVEVKEKSISLPFHHHRGNKITGIKVFENDAAASVPDTDLAKWNILVTTNDSKIRLVDLRLKKLVTRFKGCANSSSSVVASLSEDNRFVISGSEDHWCYVWENNNSNINNKLRNALKDFYLEGKNREKHSKISKVLHDKKLLKKLPIQRFMEDVNGDAYVTNENNSYASFHAHHAKVNVAMFAPDNTKKLLEYSDDVIFDLLKRAPRLAEANIYTSYEKNAARSKANGLDQGHIIVTCDTSGLIRVFRQDSAFSVRKSLLEFRKSCKIRWKNMRATEMSPVNLNKNNIRLEGINKKLMRARSMSPSQENVNILKNKLQMMRKNSTNKPSSIVSSNGTLTESAVKLGPKMVGSLSVNSGVASIPSSESMGQVTLPTLMSEDVMGHSTEIQRLALNRSTKYSSQESDQSTPKTTSDFHFTVRGRRRRASSLSTEDDRLRVSPAGATAQDQSLPSVRVSDDGDKIYV